MEKTDKYLVQRGTESFNVARDDVKFIAPDDLLLVNRDGVNYSITGAVFIEEGGGGDAAPFITDVKIEEVYTSGDRFTNSDFNVEGTLFEPAKPAETWQFKVRFDGSLQTELKSAAITAVDGEVLTLENNEDLDQFVVGANIWMLPDYIAKTSEVTGSTTSDYFTAFTLENGFSQGGSRLTTLFTRNSAGGIIPYYYRAQQPSSGQVSFSRTRVDTFGVDSVWEDTKTLTGLDTYIGLSSFWTGPNDELYMFRAGWSGVPNPDSWRTTGFKSTDGGFNWNQYFESGTSLGTGPISYDLEAGQGFTRGSNSAFGSSGWPPATGYHTNMDNWSTQCTPSYESGTNGADRGSQGTYATGCDGYGPRVKKKYWYKSSYTQSGCGTQVDTPLTVSTTHVNIQGHILWRSYNEQDVYYHNTKTGEKGLVSTGADLKAMSGFTTSISGLYPIGDYWYIIQQGKGWFVSDGTTILAWVPAPGSWNDIRLCLQGANSDETIVEPLLVPSGAQNFGTFIRGSAVQFTDSTGFEYISTGDSYISSSGATGLIVSVNTTSSIINTDTPVPVGDTLSVTVKATARIKGLDVLNSKVQIEAVTGVWVVGQTFTSGDTVATSRLWGNLSAQGRVVNLMDVEPEWTQLPGNSYWNIAFPTTFPSGNAPDVDLPEGTSITILAEAFNEVGTSFKSSNSLIPGGVTILVSGNAENEETYYKIEQAFSNYTSNVISRTAAITSAVSSLNISTDELRSYLDTQ